MLIVKTVYCTHMISFEEIFFSHRIPVGKLDCVHYMQTINGQAVMDGG
jgi:hypothetical protein